MLVESLTLKNFMTYRKKVSIDLADKNVVGIVGPNESGKSSLLQAISYASYGRTRAEREIQLINDKASGDLIVQLCILLNNEKLEIERGRTRKNEPILNVSGFRGKPSDASNYLEEKLGITYNDFVSLSYFVQGDIHQFMTGNKRDYFKRWTSGLDLWSRIEGTTKQTVKQLEESITYHKTTIESANQELDGGKALKLQREEQKGHIKRANRYKEEADLLSKQIVNLKAKIEAADMAEELADTMESLRSDLAKTGTRLSRLESSIRNLKIEIKQVKEGICPILNINCEPLEGNNQSRRSKLAADLRARQDEYKELESDKEDIEERITELKSKVSNKRKIDLKAGLREAQEQFRIVNNKYRQAESDARYAEGYIKRLVELKNQRNLSKSKLEDNSKELSYYRFIQFMSGKGGIPMQIVDSELDKVEQKCNWVLNRLGYQKQIKFSGYKELSSYVKICPVCGDSNWRKQACSSCKAPRPKNRKEEPTITILDGNSERPFAMESGGAQVLESFAVRLACSLFVSSMLGVNLRMVMLDEIFAMLDSDNRRKLMELVVNKLSTEFGLEQQLIVSHHDDIISRADNLLVVTKERGNTAVRWA